MSDWEELEKELAGLTPRAPSKDFSKRVEDALGEAGSVAMRHIPDPDPSPYCSHLIIDSLLDSTGFGCSFGFFVIPF
jgi:hypothetical protein